MKSLEALEKIKVHSLSAITGEHSSPYNEYLQSETEFIKDYDIIKQDLERLEELEKENQKLNEKAIEILQSKKIKSFYRQCIVDGKEIITYHLDSPFSTYNLTQQEYELLKEVLEWKAIEIMQPKTLILNNKW